MSVKPQAQSQAWSRCGIDGRHWYQRLWQTSELLAIHHPPIPPQILIRQMPFSFWYHGRNGREQYTPFGGFISGVGFWVQLDVRWGYWLNSGKREQVQIQCCCGVNEQRLQEGSPCAQWPSCPLPITPIPAHFYRGREFSQCSASALLTDTKHQDTPSVSLTVWESAQKDQDLEISSKPSSSTY